MLKSTNLILKILLFVTLFLVSCQSKADKWANNATVSELSLALGDPDPGIRIVAAYELSSRGQTASGATQALIKALDDPSPDVQMAAMVALGNIGSTSQLSIPKIEELLLDSDVDGVVIQAAKTLALIGDISSVPVLRQAISTKTDEGVQIEVMKAVIALDGAPQTVSEFLFVLENHTDPDVRRVAIQGLGAAADEASCTVPILSKLLYDNDRWIRMESANAIGRITGEFPASNLINDENISQSVIVARDWWSTTGQYIEWQQCSQQ